MCLSCACGEPNNAHGDDRQITMDDIRKAAEANESSPTEIVKNIQEGFPTAENAGGNS